MQLSESYAHTAYSAKICESRHRSNLSSFASPFFTAHHYETHLTLILRRTMKPFFSLRFFPRAFSAVPNAPLKSRLRLRFNDLET
jgi:hypothetical protein